MKQRAEHLAERTSDGRAPVDATVKYDDGSYLAEHPDWHVADSSWKAAHVRRLIDAHQLRPDSVCEVGCGAGEILHQLWLGAPTVTFVGYDVSPDSHALAAPRQAARLEFRLQDAAHDEQRFDLMLLMDVIEHVADPVGFLRSLHFKAERTIMHIPLELTAQAAARPGRLLRARVSSGHLHFFNVELALATIADAGYTVVASEFTAGGLDRPDEATLARLASVPRRALRSLSEPLAARLLGGFSLLVLAE